MKIRLTLLAVALVGGAMAPLANAAQGDVLGTVSLPGGTPVGLEHDGQGGLYVTTIGDDTLSRIDLNGNVQSSFVLAQSGNPIGVTLMEPGTLFVTDTVDVDVDRYTTAGAYVSSFPVGAQTTFPEGITYNSERNVLVVINGSGGNIAMEYQMDGTFIQSFPIAGSSQDGISFDPVRGTYWVCDSGSDTVRQYDQDFNEIDSFRATVNAGYASCEGVAVIGDRLYVVATGSAVAVIFELAPTHECSALALEPGVNVIDQSGAYGPQTIHGDRRSRNVIFGSAYNDVIYGGSKDDCIDGGDGNDTIYGKEGSDILIAGEGRDRVIGGVGAIDRCIIDSRDSASQCEVVEQADTM
jgi:Ca2+-binding RTX toxin-like protein